MKKCGLLFLVFNLIYVSSSITQVIVTKQNIFDLSTIEMGASPSCSEGALVTQESDVCSIGAGSIPSRCDFLFWNDFPGGPIVRPIWISDALNVPWNCEPTDPESGEAIMDHLTAWYASFPVNTEPLPRQGEGEILAFFPETNSRGIVPMTVRPATNGLDESPESNPCWTNPICNLKIPTGSSGNTIINAPERTTIGGQLYLFNGWSGIKYDYAVSPMQKSRIRGGNPLALSPNDHITAVAIYVKAPSFRSCPIGTETVGEINFGSFTIPITRCRLTPPDLMEEFDLSHPFPLAIDLCSFRPCCPPNALSCPDFNLRIEGFKGFKAGFINAQGKELGTTVKDGNFYHLSVTPVPDEPIYLFMQASEESPQGKVRLFEEVQEIEPDPVPWKYLFFGALVLSILFLGMVIRINKARAN